MSKHKYIAIIPARSGSKRLPNKNIRLLGGLPMMSWSIRSALSTSRISKTVVSTDSTQYQSIAQAEGASCEWLRSDSLAHDQTSSADMVLDVLHREQVLLKGYTDFILLQPTSPLRTTEDINAAIELFERKNAGGVVSISPAECPKNLYVDISDDLKLTDYQKEGVEGRCESKSYRINGAIYILPIKQFIEHPSFVSKGVFGYLMPRSRSIDVDTSFDFDIASHIAQNQTNHSRISHMSKEEY